MNLRPSSLSKLRRRLMPWDLAVVIVAPWLALLVRGVVSMSEQEILFLPYCLASVFLSLIFLLYFRLDLIVPKYLSQWDLGQILKVALSTVALAVLIDFTVWRLNAVPRSVPILHFFFLASGLALWRYLASGRAGGLSRPGLQSSAILIAGVGPATLPIARLVEALPGQPARVVGVLDDRKSFHGHSVGGLSVIGGCDRAGAIIAEFASHGVFVRSILVAYSDPENERAALQTLSAECSDLSVVVETISQSLGLCAVTGGLAAASQSSAREACASRAYLSRRRYVEVAAVLLGALPLAPIVALVAIAIRARLGAPVLFWQQRVGLNGNAIVLHKFRTLRPAVSESGRLLSEGERITWLGRALRATRLDELPQLYDVLRGRLSLIGPRPLLPIDLPGDPSVRLSVLPGLTGWAQVNGGQDLTPEEKNALDEWYVSHASPTLDLLILWKTLLMVLGSQARDSAAIARAIEFQKRRAPVAPSEEGRGGGVGGHFLRPGGALSVLVEGRDGDRLRGQSSPPPPFMRSSLD